MRLRAISRFNWRDRWYEVGDPIECHEEKIAARLISEGHATDELAAPQSVPTPAALPEAEISRNVPAVTALKKVSKKAKR